MKIALFPGSFDPITVGHVDIIQRAMPLFDKIVIGVGINSSKQCYFPLEKRKLFLEKTFENFSKVEITSYEGLTVSFCEKINAQYILRGLRSDMDFEFEKNIAQMNRELDKNVETVFIVCNPNFSAVSSTIVKDIIRNGGNALKFIPEPIHGLLGG